MRKDRHIGMAIFMFLFGNAFGSAVSVPFERGNDPWHEPNLPGFLKIQYFCNFCAPEVGLVAGRTAVLLVRFNHNVQDITNWNMLITSPENASRPAKVFVLTNENNLDFTNFRWSFHPIWKADINYGPPVRITTPEPGGTCELITDIVTAGCPTQAPASTTQAPTSVYIGIGIGVFVVVLIAAAVIVIVNKKRRVQLNIEALDSRYSPKADSETCNVQKSVPVRCQPMHRLELKPKHSYLELDGNGYDDIAGVASSILQPKRALPTPPDATRSEEDGYLTLVTASLSNEIPAPLKTKDKQFLPAHVTSYPTPMTTDISMHKLSTL